VFHLASSVVYLQSMRHHSHSHPCFYLTITQFPLMPAKVLEMDDVSAYNVAAAYLAKNLVQDAKKVATLFPDESRIRNCD